VLCEKPLAMNMVEAEAIVAAAQRAQRLFTMGFQLRQSRAYRALKGFIEEGRLGEVYHTRVWSGHIMAYPWGRYHHLKEYSYGGVMAATVIHILDAAMWVLGAPEPVAVSASTFRRLKRMPDPPIDFEGTPDDVTVEDFSHAHVRFADGSSMSIEGEWLMHPCGRSSGFEIHGVLGLARDNGGGVELERKKDIVEEKLVPEGEEPVDRTAAEHEEFIAAIEGKGEPVVRFKEALGVQRILGGIYASAEAGAEVKV
jgi:predicted dehydrogenase